MPVSFQKVQASYDGIFGPVGAIFKAVG